MNANRILSSVVFGLVLVLAVALSCAAWAQSKPARNLAVQKVEASEQRVALVIGNAGYASAPLRNPVNDATDIAVALRTLGFGVTLKTNANQRQMKEAIRDFGDQLTKGGVGLFYFAGHGIQFRGRNFLVPVGANIEREAHIEDETVDASFVLAQMEDARNRLNIVVLDACRNNPYGRSFRSATRGLAQMDAAQGTLVAFATAPGSIAQDGEGRNGIYTTHLLRQMRAPGLPVELMFKRVRDAVISDTKDQQVPWESSSLRGTDFYFVPGAGGSPAPTMVVPAPATDPAMLELALWESVKDSKNAEEINAYLEEYPNGRFAGLARTRLKSLEAAARPPVQVATVAPSTQPTPAPVAPLADSLQGLKPGTVFKDCDSCPEMVVIPAGNFTMGSPELELERNIDEGPQHTVTIARQFAAGRFEVTFDEWDACVREGGCGHNPDDDGWGRGRRPVMRVSWDDAMQYVQWLSRKTGRSYRLLTEAEWEYVARAGTMTAYSWGNSITPQQANYNTKMSYAGSPVAASARGQTAPVGSFKPNAFGLYDVHGNVWEWTEDCWNGYYSGAPANGNAWASGDCGRRVQRGGSWNSNPRYLRSAIRTGANPANRYLNDYGFRVTRTD